MKKAALLIAALILCLTLTGCSMLQSKSRESLTQWVADHREAWKKIVSAPQTAGIVRLDRGLADLWSGLFRDGQLENVWYNPDTGDYDLRFNGIAEPLEGDQYLIWSRRSMEEIAPLFPNDPGTLEEKTDTRMYWTGIGSGRRGYVLVERIDENWYYVEYNDPT
jgi:hypothetical protein